MTEEAGHQDGKVVPPTELSPGPSGSAPMTTEVLPAEPLYADSARNSGRDQRSNGRRNQPSWSCSFYDAGIKALRGRRRSACEPSGAPRDYRKVESQFKLRQPQTRTARSPGTSRSCSARRSRRPPSRRKTNIHTLTPKRRDADHNPGDVAEVADSDPRLDFTTRVTDMTTHQSGFMVASRGLMASQTLISDCNGFPHTFHAEYSTARAQKTRCRGPAAKRSADAGGNRPL